MAKLNLRACCLAVFFRSLPFGDVSQDPDKSLNAAIGGDFRHEGTAHMTKTEMVKGHVGFKVHALTGQDGLDMREQGGIGTNTQRQPVSFGRYNVLAAILSQSANGLLTNWYRASRSQWMMKTDAVSAINRSCRCVGEAPCRLDAYSERFQVRLQVSAIKRL